MNWEYSTDKYIPTASLLKFQIFVNIGIPGTVSTVLAAINMVEIPSGDSSKDPVISPKQG